MTCRIGCPDGRGRARRHWLFRGTAPGANDLLLRSRCGGPLIDGITARLAEVRRLQASAGLFGTTRAQRHLRQCFKRLANALASSENVWTRPAFDLTIETSLRQDMLFQVCWDWVDIESRTISVPSRLRDKGNKGVPAVLPLSSSAVVTLRSMPQRLMDTSWRPPLNACSHWALI